MMDSKIEGSYIHWLGTGQNGGEITKVERKKKKGEIINQRYVRTL